MKHIGAMIAMSLLCGAAWAKLPTPVLNDEQKAKAAEAAAKTAHGNKVANYQLCKSMDRTAAHYFKTAKAAGKETKPATDTGACLDPGAFVWPVPAAPAAATPAPAAPVAAAPAKPTAAPAKK
ncbi:MAG: hypothetical protein ACKO1L_07520 [Brachymonas sp.]